MCVCVIEIRRAGYFLGKPTGTQRKSVADLSLMLGKKQNKSQKEEKPAGKATQILSPSPPPLRSSRYGFPTESSPVSKL